MTINIRGTLTSPVAGEVIADAVVRFIAAAGSTIILPYATSEFITDSNGAYDVQLQYGHYTIWVKHLDTFEYLGYCIVNESSPTPMTIQELLEYTQPIPNAQVDYLDAKWQADLDAAKTLFDTDIREVKDQVVDGDAAVVTQMTTYTNDRIGTEVAETLETLRAEDVIVLNQATAYSDTQGAQYAESIALLQTDNTEIKATQTTYENANSTAHSQLQTLITQGDAAILQSAQMHTDTVTGELESTVLAAIQAGDDSISQELNLTKDSLGNTQANWEVVASVDDLTSNIGIVNDGITSELYAVADKFKFTSTVRGVPVTPFTVVGDEVHMTKVVLGVGSSVGYDKVTGSKPPVDATHGATLDQITAITAAQNTADTANSAANAADTRITSEVSTLNTTIADSIALVDGKITAEESARIQAILDEEAARATAIQARVTAEAALDGKITAEEQARIQLGTDLTTAYQEYANTVKQALIDGEISDAENSAIAAAQAQLDSAKAALEADINTAQSTAESKTQTFYQSTEPVATAVGDIWVNPANNHRVSHWDGTYWEYVQEQDQIQSKYDVLQNLTQTITAQATADGKIETFFQDEQPASANEGDIWLDTNDGNKQYIYLSGTWTVAQDQAIGQAIADAAGAQATADGKVTTFYQANQPTTNSVGDLWVDTDDNNRMHRWDGAAWQDIQDGQIGTALANAAAAQDAADTANANLASAITSLNQDIADLQAQTDGNISTWFYAYAPTLTNEPALSWTDNATKNTHLADLFYDTATGYVYRFTVDNAVYSWQQITDTDATQALANAAAAQDTADNKRRVFVVQPTPPYDIGDLWAQGTSGDLMKCKVAKSSSDSYAAGDWENATSYATDISALDTTVTQHALDIATVDGRVDTEEAARIQAITDEQTARANDIAVRIQAEADLDGKITAEESARVQQATDLTTAYQNYADTVKQALIDGEISQAETAAIQEAQNRVDTAKQALEQSITSVNDDLTAFVDVTFVNAQAGLQTQIDGKSETWIQLSTDTDPKVTWTTAELKQAHNGDVLYFTDTKKLLAYSASTHSWTELENQKALDALSAADGAQQTADGKITTFYSTSVPTAEGEGDLWVDTGKGNELKRWNGTQWISMKDASIQAAQDTADSKITTFTSATAPTTDSLGDLWIDTANGNQLKRWNGTAWILVRDTGIQDAQDAADAAQQTADGKITTYYQSTAPVTPTEGDIWFDTANGKQQKVYLSGTWTDAQDTAIGDAITAAAGAQSTADGKVTTFYQSGTPTAEGEGDLWVRTNQGNELYRWNGTAWASIQDAAINAAAQAAADAAQAASDAQGTADGKVDIFYQNEAPTGVKVGDLWIDLDNGKQLFRYSGTEWESVQDTQISDALAAASNAQGTADGKITSYYQATSPVSPSSGDLWTDTTTDRTYRWDGVYWESLQHVDIVAAKTETLSALASAVISQAGADMAQATADGKIVTYFQDTQPTGAAEGDIWFDTDDGNKQYVYVSGVWTQADNTRIGQAISDASQAQQTADTKVIVFYDTVAPTEGVSTGDLWIDTDNGNVMKRWDGAEWISVQDTAIAAASQAIATINGDISALQAQVDKSITTWFEAHVPDLTNTPAMDWTTDEDKNVHLADMFYNTTTGYAYRFMVSGGIYSWQRITDTDVTKALEDAANAQATADGKITTFYGDSEPAALRGDLWYRPAHQALYRHSGFDQYGVVWVRMGDITNYDDSRVANDSLTKDNLTDAGMYPDQDNLQIKSSNYEQDLTGWAVDKDGTAEFNEVTVRGTVVASDFIGGSIDIGEGKFSVSNTGKLTATGATIKSADSGSRLVIDNDRLEVWDGNSLRVRLGRL